jgi:putative membrane protein
MIVRPPLHWLRMLFPSAQEIAEPFGTDPNCLVLDTRARNIERSLLEQCGEPVRAPLAPCPRYHIS